MSVLLVTGSSGLVGGTAVDYFYDAFDRIVGVDNDFRARFFGPEASTKWRTRQLVSLEKYVHSSVDIRDLNALSRIFDEYGADIECIIHAAAQPSHDWAARDPILDHEINTSGTLNLLECFRKHSPKAVFIHCSTNKVYGDTPNFLPLVETDTRFELVPDHPYYDGVPETMTIDNSLHSVFGASKLAADVYVQEYGRYFGLNTGVFRGGCLTGPTHSGAPLHGFLSYLMQTAVNGKVYEIIGYGGKQVRDNIHSSDLHFAFDLFRKDPDPGAVYNIGGTRHSNCSVLEAINLIEKVIDKRVVYRFNPNSRKGDHKWYVSSMDKFKRRYPIFKHKWETLAILEDLLSKSTR